MTETWKSYHSTEDFERGRRKMFDAGWVVAEEKTTAGKTGPVSTGSFADLVFWPILWLFNKTQPERYVRAEDL